MSKVWIAGRFIAKTEQGVVWKILGASDTDEGAGLLCEHETDFIGCLEKDQDLTEEPALKEVEYPFVINVVVDVGKALGIDDFRFKCKQCGHSFIEQIKYGENDSGKFSQEVQCPHCHTRWKTRVNYEDDKCVTAEITEKVKPLSF